MIFTEKNISNDVNTYLSKNNFSSIFILIDENTKQDCLPLLKLDFTYKIIEIKSGEEHKTLETCQFIWKTLLENNADRKSLLINLGGGVICDMGGFCASTYKRGIDFINIPTTLLALVDASVGSKTGIDFQAQKNMIGIFSEASEIFINTQFLKTLTTRELLSGFAEVLKHGLIYEEKYFNDCITSYLDKTIDWKDVVKKSIKIKSSIVEKDPKENGLRKILNYGHTFGHAFESYSLQFHKKSLLHGEAVVLGIICSLHLSEKYIFIKEEKINEIITKIQAIYKFINIEDFNLNKLFNFVMNDKKNISNKLNYIILREIGNPIFDFEVTKNDFEDSLLFLNKKVFKND